MTGGHSATDILATPAAPAGDVEARPYAPSWLDGIVDWIDRLPGLAWLAYLERVL